MLKISELSVRRPVAMSMVILLILIIGLVSLSGLAVDLFPEIDFPIAAITASYPGIGPEEMENLIVSPIENILGTIPNVETINSTARLGGALIIVQFNWGTDMDYATLQVRERLDLIRDALPNEMPLPTVFKFDPRVLPIMQLAVSSPDYNLLQTKRIAENRIKPRLEPIAGIAAINVEGGEEPEIRISVHPATLDEYGLQLQTLQSILRAENINLPAGMVDERDLTIPLRIVGQFSSIEELEDFPIPTNKGVIPLGSIASIEERFKNAQVLSFLNGEPSVGISIQKQTDANTVAVAREVHRALAELREEIPYIHIEPIFDSALYINQSLRVVAINMLIGSILAGIVLFLFLRHLKSTLIVAFSIPISIVGTFILMYFSNQTLNLLTLGGLALGIGMMVDNSIVILENIYRYRQLGYSKVESAIRGTKEVSLPVIAATLTTVIVFLPIIFVEGLAAQLFKPLALSVTYALLASLFTSLIIVPLFASKYIEITEKESRFQTGFTRLQSFYRRVLGWCIRHPKKIVLSILALLILSLAGTPFIGTEFLPQQDESILYMDARLPVGTGLEATLELDKEIQQRLEGVEEIKNIYVTVGGAGQFQMTAGTLTNRANYNIQLVPLNERQRSDREVADELRDRLRDLPDVRLNISAGDTGFGGAQVSLQIRGYDVNVLESLGQDVVEIISQIEGIREAQSDFTTGQEEIRIIIDRRIAANYGLTSVHIAAFIRESIEGQLATRISRGGEEIDVILALPLDSIDIETLQTLEMTSPLGMKVPIANLTSFEPDTSPHTIRRVNRIREVQVSAQLLDRDLGSTVKEIRRTLAEELSLPAGYSIHFGGQNEQMIDAFQKLTGALILAVILVYMIMSAQFESYFYPFIILFAVPLTAIGVIIGLLVTFRPLGVPAMVGILVLTGIVVNNAIVFVDYVNTLRREGMSRDEALLQAGPIRLRPILMTALTTVIGLIPLMLGFGEGAEIQAPMATVIVFGLTFATLITLVFVPVMYKLLDEWRERRRARKGLVEDI